MKTYFDEKSSVAHCTDGSVDAVLSAVAKRYMKANPKGPLTFRAYSRRGIMRVADFRYEADFNTLFPDAKDEEYVFAWAKTWSASDEDHLFDINCYGPVLMMVNGEEAWRSNVLTERDPEALSRVTFSLKKGWNNFVIRAKKTRGGFGWKFGPWIGKHPQVFMMPSAERANQEGWLFSNPLPSAQFALPEMGQAEKDAGVEWNPAVGWTEDKLALGNCARIYGECEGKTVLGWTTVEVDAALKTEWSGSFKGGVRVLCDGQDVFSAGSSGEFSGVLELSPGKHDVMVLSTGSADGWGFELSPGVKTQPPCDLQGSGDTWLFAGPFDPENLPDVDGLKDFYVIHETLDGSGYWRLDAPGTYLRLYNDNPLFGYWNYPLGVALYGLFHAGLMLESDEIKDYVCQHVQFSCSAYLYSKWDYEMFGHAPHLHNLLSSIDSLDDCGSFGSTMLEVAKHCDITGVEPIMELIGDFISNRQDRFDDGAFMRLDLMHTFHNNTMWADDLYMSVPFLCRYYKVTGDRKYIDDAANQFFGFKKRLYMPEHKIMSHVYDVNRKIATGVPWGRGNGWTLFSLTELLAVLPDDHEKRDELMAFFRELCEGFLALQDEDGMWHQVLTHPESYPETSCTSMFIYGFSRGVRFGWFEDSKPYVGAVKKAWGALTRISIQSEGSIHGVCRGSEFSFTPDYYIEDLLWNLNDTHGVGIVLLAGVECRKMHAFLKQEVLKQTVLKQTVLKQAVMI